MATGTPSHRRRRTSKNSPQCATVVLNLYRKRWGIECMFADAKTRGLNIEDTHITDPDKLSNLLVLVALAVTWAYRCATRVMGRRDIRRKGHGRREKSWFRIGLDALRKWIIHHPIRFYHRFLWWIHYLLHIFPRWTEIHPKWRISTVYTLCLY